MRKKLLSALMIMAVSLSVSAQNSGKYTGTAVTDRIGHGQDSIDVMQSISNYRQDFRAGNYEAAYEFWKIAFTKGPLSQIRVYTNGAQILDTLVVRTQDAAQKQAYFDELMQVYDQRLKYLPDLNSFADEKDVVTTGYVLCRKADDYYRFAPKMDLETAYKMYHDGIDNLGKNIEAYILYDFIYCSYQRYMSNKENTEAREDFIQDYLLCDEICDDLLGQAREFAESDTIRAQKIVANYWPTKERCNELFNSSKAADCQTLDMIYADKVEANKANASYLNGVLKVLINFDCDKSTIYDKVAKYAYEASGGGAGSSMSALGMAKRALKSGNESEAAKYLKQALDAETDGGKKAKMALTIAGIYYKQGNISGCQQYCRTALQYQPSMGKAYLLIANCIVRQAKGDHLEKSKYYCLAIDKCYKAKAVDPGCAASANRQAAGYRAGLYPQSEAFFQGLKAGQKVTVLGETTTLRFR